MDYKTLRNSLAHPHFFTAGDRDVRHALIDSDSSDTLSTNVALRTVRTENSMCPMWIAQKSAVQIVRRLDYGKSRKPEKVSESRNIEKFGFFLHFVLS